MFLRSKEREFERLLKETANAQDELPKLLLLLKTAIGELTAKARHLQEREAKKDSPKDENTISVDRFTEVASGIEEAYNLMGNTDKERHLNAKEFIKTANTILLSIEKITPNASPVRAAADAVYRYVSGNQVYSVGKDRGDKIRAVKKAVHAIDAYLKSLPGLEEGCNNLTSSLSRSHSG